MVSTLATEKPKIALRFTLMLLCTLALDTAPAVAQDGSDRALGWFFTGELAAVLTGGNSSSRTFGFGGTLRRVWTKSELKFEGGGTRTESSLITRTAVGTSQDDFMLNEQKNTEVTAELYYARGRYDYSFTQKFFGFLGVDWLRNTFAGIDSRFLLAAGAGNSWIDSDRVKFKTDYGATYTFEQEVVENPLVASDFVGLRLAYDFRWTLTASTDFQSVFISDWNLDNTDDVRVDFKNDLPISISETFSLKPTLQLLWRNDPSLAAVPLFAPDGTQTGQNVFVPLEKLDTLFTLALVVKI